MILRSITRHVESQNWFAVWLDLFIVVFGVFIGIQVANWNETRVDQQRTQGYLERISADLESDIDIIEARSEFWRQVAGYGAVGLKYTNTGDAGGHSNWELLLAYFQASQVAELLLSQSTFDELKSAGELRLIPNVDLRTGLARYYLFPASATVNQRPPYREHVRGLIPVDIQNYIWDFCYATNEVDNQQMLPCPSPIDEESAAKIVNTISTDVGLMNELRYWMSTEHVMGIIARGLSEGAAGLRQQVEEQIGELAKGTEP